MLVPSFTKKKSRKSAFFNILELITLSHKNGANWYGETIFCLLFTLFKLFIARTNNLKEKIYKRGNVPIQKIMFVPKCSSPHKSKIIEILITVLKLFSSDQIADIGCTRIVVQAIFGIKTLKNTFLTEVNS